RSVTILLNWESWKEVFLSGAKLRCTYARGHGQRRCNSAPPPKRYEYCRYVINGRGASAPLEISPCLLRLIDRYCSVVLEIRQLWTAACKGHMRPFAPHSFISWLQELQPLFH